MDKQERLAELSRAWSECRGCGLSQTRRNVVVGFGNPHARIMLIGEAPGANEDEEGLPFVGLSGQLMDNILAAVSADPAIVAAEQACHEVKGNERLVRARELRSLLWQEYFFTNIIGCHPPENRDPSNPEVTACIPRLHYLIQLVDPMLIIGCGRVAVETLLKRRVQITHAQGEMFDIQIPGQVISYTIPVLATLHPSYLLRKNDFNNNEGDVAATYSHYLRAMRIQDEFDKAHYGVEPPPQRPLET